MGLSAHLLFCMMDVNSVGKQKIITKDNKIRITNCLDKFERINTEELKALANGVVPGLFPVAVEKKRKKYHLAAELSNQMALESYCHEWMDTSTILSIICDTLEIASACERRGLRPGNLCWDVRCVFVDQTNGKISMLYWPVLRLESSDVDMLQFYRGFLEYMERDEVEHTVFTLYANYFSQRDSMNLFSFQTLMRRIQLHWNQHQNAETLEMKKQQYAMNYEYRQWPNRNKGNAWLESSADTRKIWLNRERVIIGRSKQQCDVTIHRDNSVSRCHACIIKDGQRYLLKDLGSKNGTYIGQRRLTPHIPERLENGEVIRLGDSCFTFREMVSDQTVLMFRT